MDRSTLSRRDVIWKPRIFGNQGIARDPSIVTSIVLPNCCCDHVLGALVKPGRLPVPWANKVVARVPWNAELKLVTKKAAAHHSLPDEDCDIATTNRSGLTC